MSGLDECSVRTMHLHYSSLWRFVNAVRWARTAHALCGCSARTGRCHCQSYCDKANTIWLGSSV